MDRVLYYIAFWGFIEADGAFWGCMGLQGLWGLYGLLIIIMHIYIYIPNRERERERDREIGFRVLQSGCCMPKGPACHSLL